MAAFPFSVSGPVSRAVGFFQRHAVMALVMSPVGIFAGATSAIFLMSLDAVTATRQARPWLVFLLPFAGAAVAELYRRFGKDSDRGHELIADGIRTGECRVPARTAFFVFGGTLITHLFGGSAGREGAAVQMGGSLSAAYARTLRFDPEKLRLALICGVSAGFGAVFGTPFAGAIFACEMPAAGPRRFSAFLPALAASFVGDRVCAATGVKHTAYAIAGARDFFSPELLLGALGAAVFFAFAARAYGELARGVKFALSRLTASPVWRAACGGALVVALWKISGTDDYLGLGVVSPDPHGVSIVSSFATGGAGAWSWAWKLVFTAVTIGAGLKGGEVTPLFFIGAAAGNAFATLAGLPTDLFAGLGFVAVFAGATRTPLACSVMALEIFGPRHGILFAAACFASSALANLGRRRG